MRVFEAINMDREGKEQISERSHEVGIGALPTPFLRDHPLFLNDILSECLPSWARCFSTIYWSRQPHANGRISLACSIARCPPRMSSELPRSSCFAASASHLMRKKKTRLNAVFGNFRKAHCLIKASHA